MDTVRLDGKHFNAKAVQGQKVKRGDILAEFDLDALKEEGFDVTTPIIVTNSGQYTDIIPTDQKKVKTEEQIITLISSPWEENNHEI